MRGEVLRHRDPPRCFFPAAPEVGRGRGKGLTST